MTASADRSLQPQRPDVIDETFDGEAVLVQLRTGCYYALNVTASVIWAGFAGGRSAATVAASLGLDAAVVAAFAGRLVDEELLEGAPADAGPFTAEQDADGGLPELQRFTDMQDLLMLDPIHDIDLDGDGWPVAAAGE